MGKNDTDENKNLKGRENQRRELQSINKSDSSDNSQIKENSQTENGENKKFKSNEQGHVENDLNSEIESENIKAMNHNLKKKQKVIKVHSN